MTTDESQSPEQAPKAPEETRAAPPSDDPVAAALRGFGPLGIVASLVIVALGPVLEPLGGILVLLWAKRSRTPWSELGFVRPKSWARTVIVGIVLGIALKVLMKSIVMPLLGAGPINQAYHYLVGNRAALPEMLFDIIAGAGFAEETVFRGFMFERLGKLLGRGAGAKTATVLLTSLWFGLVHYPVQRLPGAEQAVITGLVFGAIFAVTGRIWMLMFAHVAFDLTALWMIYWNLETKVAHLFFR
jgi:membrane protease YdiL (CAAX protease family)